MGVFPTHVGVFLLPAAPHRSASRLPHARGGVSIRTRGPSSRGRSSPRTWGCFYQSGRFRCCCYVFPTHVGVFLRGLAPKGGGCCLPHARGGVSPRTGESIPIPASSPRTWGCFCCPVLKNSAFRGLPHARGGVSELQFLRGAKTGVFPTHVGVFPSGRTVGRSGSGLPHARGGVSAY